MERTLARVRLVTEALERVVDTAPTAISATKASLALFHGQEAKQCSDEEGQASVWERFAAGMATHVFASGVFGLLTQDERARDVLVPLTELAADAAEPLLVGASAAVATEAAQSRPSSDVLGGLVALVRTAFATAADTTVPGIARCFACVASDTPDSAVARWKRVVALLCAFYQRAANAFPPSEQPRECQPAAFVPRLLAPLFAHVASSSPPAAAMLAEAITKACNLGQRDGAVVELLRRHSGSPLVVQAFPLVPQHARAPILVALASSTAADMKVFAVYARACLEADRARTTTVLATQLCVVRPVRGKRRVGAFVAALAELGVLREAATSTARTWAEPAFVARTAFEQHRDVTALLCGMVGEVGQSRLHEWELIAPLLEGVNTHLSASAERVRRLGMKVAVAVSIAIDPEHPLSFDGMELSDHEDEEDEDEDGDDESRVEEEETRASSKRNSKKHQDRGVDPDEVVDLSSQLDADEDSGNEAEDEQHMHDQEEEDADLQAYSLEDDYSDLEDDKRPSFIGQCLEALFDQKEDADKIREALVSLDSLVDRAPHETGLADHAADVLDALLFYHNSAGVEDFARMKHHILLRTTECCPAECARVLCRAFYEDNHMLVDRTEILAVLHDAALSLSSLEHNRAEEQRAQTTQDALLLLPPAPRAELVPLRAARPASAEALGLTEARTRRWHTIREAGSTPAPTRNRFLDCADAFFYPLLAQHDKPLFVEQPFTKIWSGGGQKQHT